MAIDKTDSVINTNINTKGKNDVKIKDAGDKISAKGCGDNENTPGQIVVCGGRSLNYVVSLMDNDSRNARFRLEKFKHARVKDFFVKNFNEYKRNFYGNGSFGRVLIHETSSTKRNSITNETMPFVVTKLAH